MPCGAKDHCLIPNLTPGPPHFTPDKCRCGCYLHGICGIMVRDRNGETNRVCFKCHTPEEGVSDERINDDGPTHVSASSSLSTRSDIVGKKGGSNLGASAANTISDDVLSNGAKRKGKQKATPGGAEKRTRLTLIQKGEVLDLLGGKDMDKAKVAERYGVGVRTVARILANKKELEMQLLAGGKGDEKAVRKPQFPEVDSMVLGFVEEARRAGLPVSRETIRSFGRKAKAQLLGKKPPGADTKGLESFDGGEKWAKNFLQRHGMISVSLNGEAGGLDKETIAQSLRKSLDTFKKYPLCDINNTDETGILYKVMPRRTYLAPGEIRKTANLALVQDDRDEIVEDAVCVANTTSEVDEARVEMSEDETEIQDGDMGEGTGLPLPPYVEVAPLFLELQRKAEESGLEDVCTLLHKAKMKFLSAYASRPVLQTDT
ncbi:unnamed protein product [Choristocarpus tenellus]